MRASRGFSRLSSLQLAKRQATALLTMVRLKCRASVGCEKSKRFWLGSASLTGLATVTAARARRSFLAPSKSWGSVRSISAKVGGRAGARWLAAQAASSWVWAHWRASGAPWTDCKSAGLGP